MNSLKKTFGKNCKFECPAAIDLQESLECLTENLKACSANALGTKDLLWSFAYFNGRPEQIVHFCEHRGILTVITMVIKHGTCARVRSLDYNAYICDGSRFPKDVFELSVKIDYCKQGNLLNGKAGIAHCMAKGNNENKGYGSLVMGEFLCYINKLHADMDIRTVSARLSPVDEANLDNKNRRNHFYEKHGFKIEGEWAILSLCI